MAATNFKTTKHTIVMQRQTNTLKMSQLKWLHTSKHMKYAFTFVSSSSFAPSDGGLWVWGYHMPVFDLHYSEEEEVMQVRTRTELIQCAFICLYLRLKVIIKSMYWCHTKRIFTFLSSVLLGLFCFILTCLFCNLLFDSNFQQVSMYLLTHSAKNKLRIES